MITPLSRHLEKLVGFVTIARTGSLTAACRELGVTQPTLSHSMRVLEETVGSPLFVRLPRGMELTKEGQTLFAFASRLLYETAALQDELRPRSEIPAGVLEVGTKEPYAIHLWPQYLRSLGAVFPKLSLRLSIRKGNSELVQLLVDNELELLLIAEPRPQAQLVAFALLKDRYGLFCSPELARAKASARRAAPLILFSRALSAGGKPLGQRLPRARARHLLEVDSFDAALAMAKQNLGVAVLSQVMAREEVARGALAALPAGDGAIDTGPAVSVCLCIAAKKKKDSRLRQVIGHLRAYQRELSAREISALTC